MKQLGERLKRLETKRSQGAESQASREHLRHELTSFLHAVRAWATQNQLSQTPDDAGASEMEISPEVDGMGFNQLLQQAITEWLKAVRDWARSKQQPQALIEFSNDEQGPKV
jgi:hypothetical protein